MIENPSIVDVPAITAAAIALNVPSSEIGQHMGPAISEVFATLKAQGIAPTGPWFTYHHKAPDAFFDVNICVPVKAGVSPSGRVVAYTMPAHKAVRTVYHGGYEGLGQGWSELMAWIATSDMKTRADLWEVYAAGPESVSDSMQYRTELNKPLV